VRDTVSSASALDRGGVAPAPLHPDVAAALARLEQLDGTPAAEHVEILDEVHRLLQDALASLDEA
jgi:hypothetical protein